VSRMLSPLVWQTWAWCMSRKRAGSGDLGACSPGTRPSIAVAGGPVAGFAGSGQASACRELAFSGGVEDGFDHQSDVAVVEAGDGIAEGDGGLAGEAGCRAERSAFPS